MYGEMLRQDAKASFASLLLCLSPRMYNPRSQCHRSYAASQGQKATARMDITAFSVKILWKSQKKFKFLTIAQNLDKCWKVLKISNMLEIPNF